MPVTASRLGPNRTDAALAAVLTVVGLAQVTSWPIAPGPLGHAYVLGTTVPLAWRRTRPVPAALVSSSTWLVPVDGFPVLGFVTALLVFFGLGAHGAPGRVVAATAAWGAGAGIVGTLLGPEPPVAVLGAVLIVVAPTLAGRLVAHLQRQNAELAQLTHHLREERRQAQAVAVEVERARIAQELHDVVGHEVTLIAVQAEAAASALRHAPERAAEPVEAIRTTAHRTLAEIRAVLDVVAPENRAQEVSEDLPELARRARQAGIPNTLTVHGVPSEHGAPRLAVNRIVRECLTNAGRHAPGQPVDIDVVWGHQQVVVRASNPTTSDGPAAPGRGLSGIRHRAELLGGAFQASCREGRFDVRVAVPLAGSGPVP